MPGNDQFGGECEFTTTGWKWVHKYPTFGKRKADKKGSPIFLTLATIKVHGLPLRNCIVDRKLPTKKDPQLPKLPCWKGVDVNLTTKIHLQKNEASDLVFKIKV